MADARFEDGADQPLRLRAETPEDLVVLSALVQDAVTEPGGIAWMKRRRRLAILLNRFRWEDRDAATQAGRAFERVRALLVIGEVTAVRGMGIDPKDRDQVLSLLSLAFQPGPDGAGTLRLVFSGDGEVAAETEALDVTLTDVARPHAARGEPGHGD
jgi:hypothetical protein